MINRLHRFHGYNALRFVYKQGRTFRVPLTAEEEPLFVLRVAANPRRKTYRLAVVVSKKQSKSAVVRNRIRRRLYEVAREVVPRQLPDIGGYDLVLTVMTDKVATIPQKIIHNTLLRIVQMSGIRHK